MKSDSLIDPRPLHLRRCCGEMPIVHRFSNLGCYAIECRINGHIHNSGLCDTLKQACKEWNSKAQKFDELDALAIRTGVSKSEMIREATMEYVKRHTAEEGE